MVQVVLNYKQLVLKLRYKSYLNRDIPGPMIDYATCYYTGYTLEVQAGFFEGS